MRAQLPTLGMALLLAGCGPAGSVHLSGRFMGALQAGQVEKLESLSRGEAKVAAELASLKQASDAFDSLDQQLHDAQLMDERRTQELRIRNDELDIDTARLEDKPASAMIKHKALDETTLRSMDAALRQYESLEVPARGSAAVLAEMSALAGPLDACRTQVKQMLGQRVYVLHSQPCRGITWKDAAS